MDGHPDLIMYTLHVLDCDEVRNPVTSDEMLLMAAAAAASIEFEYCRIELGGCRTKTGWWNPLADSKQAFELLVQLRLPLSFCDVQFSAGPVSICGTYWDAEDSEHYHM